MSTISLLRKIEEPEHTNDPTVGEGVARPSAVPIW